MAATEHEKEGVVEGEYLSTSKVRAGSRTFCPIQTMTWIHQKTNGRKEEKTGRI